VRRVVIYGRSRISVFISYHYACYSVLWTHVFLYFTIKTSRGFRIRNQENSKLPFVVSSSTGATRGDFSVSKFTCTAVTIFLLLIEFQIVSFRTHSFNRTTIVENGSAFRHRALADSAVQKTKELGSQIPVFSAY